MNAEGQPVDLRAAIYAILANQTTAAPVKRLLLSRLLYALDPGRRNYQTLRLLTSYAQATQTGSPLDRRSYMQAVGYAAREQDDAARRHDRDAIWRALHCDPLDGRVVRRIDGGGAQ